MFTWSQKIAENAGVTMEVSTKISSFVMENFPSARMRVRLHRMFLKQSCVVALTQACLHQDLTDAEHVALSLLWPTWLEWEAKYDARMAKLKEAT